MQKMENPMEIRCLVKNDGDQWSAMCLDFGLAAQGNSFDDAKNKLFEQIEEYVVEACTVDKENKDALLSRKGPISWFIVFYLARLHLKSKELFAFTEVKQNFATHA